MVQPMSWAVQLHWGTLKKDAFDHNGDIQYSVAYAVRLVSQILIFIIPCLFHCYTAIGILGSEYCYVVCYCYSKVISVCQL